MHASGEVTADCAADAAPADRWALVLPHHERLLRIARRRTQCEQDAEDCVQEAMIRCVSFDALDVDRVGPLLTSVTIRICADLGRAQQRAMVASRRLHADERLSPGPDEIACDRDEARWFEARVERLADRERAVLLARADGASVGEAADALGITYKAAEAAFTRARVKLCRGLPAGAGPGGAGHVTAPPRARDARSGPTRRGDAASAAPVPAGRAAAKPVPAASRKPSAAAGRGGPLGLVAEPAYVA